MIKKSEFVPIGVLVGCLASNAYVAVTHKPAPAWPLNVPPSGAPKTPTVMDAAVVTTNTIATADTTGTNGAPFLTKQDLHYVALLAWRNGFVCGYSRAMGTNEHDFSYTATSNMIERIFR